MAKTTTNNIFVTESSNTAPVVTSATHFSIEYSFSTETNSTLTLGDQVNIGAISTTEQAGNNSLTVATDCTIGSISGSANSGLVIPTVLIEQDKTLTCLNPILLAKMTLENGATFIHQPRFSFDSEPLKGNFYVRAGENFTIKSTTGLDITIFKTEIDGTVTEYQITSLDTKFDNNSLFYTQTILSCADEAEHNEHEVALHNLETCELSDTEMKECEIPLAGTDQ